MKRIFITSVVIFFLMFAAFILRVNADEQPPLVETDPIISMDFKDAKLKDLLKVFSIQAGLNFIASESVQDRTITLYLDKVPLSQAMDKIFSANNLSYELDKKANIFVVKEWGRMGTETVTKVFFLKYATVSNSALKDELFKISPAPISKGDGGITSAVRKLLSPVGSMIEDFRTNSFIITDTPMQMKVISQVITALDVAVPQVILEMEMLDVSKNTVDKLGIDFGDAPFTAIITGASASMGFPYGSYSDLFNQLKGMLSINEGDNSYKMQLDFMRTQIDTKSLARPKLLTLNNQTAEIAIVKDEALEATPQYSTTTTGASYLSGYSVTRASGNALTNKGIGITLKVTPQIDLETNTITMVINPESSATTPSSFSTSAFPILDPEIRSTKSIVKVKDGETVILGGLIHQDKNIIVRKLPILGDIPILGMLFRHKNQTTAQERELIIFITPHIVRDKGIAKLAQVQNIQLPIREQAVAVGSNRDYIISANMNKFDKSINGKR